MSEQLELPIIDPTLNVKELVTANERYRDELRISDRRYFEMVIKKDFQYQEAMRRAEAQRINDLTTQKASFDLAQITTLRLQVEGGFAAINVRLSGIEQWRYENSGKNAGAVQVVGYIITIVTLAITALAAFFRR